MATISKRISKKTGAINYSIQIKIKDRFTGKSKFLCTTWHNKDNLTGKLAQDTATAFAVKWEKQMRNGLSKFNHSDDSNITFREISHEWLDVKKNSISETYYARSEACLSRINDYFGDIKLVDIRARDVQKFFKMLSDYRYKIIRAVVRENSKEKLNEAAISYGVRKICNENSISRITLFHARKGELIEWKSAIKICRSLNLDINEIFKKIVVEKAYERNTIIKYKAAMCSIFSYAIKAELVSINYASMAYLDDHIEKKKPKKGEVLSDQEFSRLLATLEKNPIHQTIPIYLMALTGLRSCENCGLEWQDIDFEKRTITIERNRVYLPGLGIIRRDFMTKNEHSKRTLYMCDLLYEKLKLYKAYYDKLKHNDNEFDNCGAVYCNEKGQPAFPHHLNALLKRFLIEANCKVISPHKMRHTWITTLIDNGVKANVVSKMAGHSNPTITLNIYTHYRKENDNSKEVLENVFSKSKLKLA